jgi:hypothetical protein
MTTYEVADNSADCGASLADRTLLINREESVLF